VFFVSFVVLLFLNFLLPTSYFLLLGEYMSLRICVAGVTGWVGAPLCRAIANSDDLTLVGAVARNSSGKNLAELLSDPGIDLIVNGSVVDALTSPVDVFVDYTKADAVKTNVLAAIERDVNVVIGSSGLTETDFREIDEKAKARNVGVIAAGNFAITAVLLKRFALEAAKYLSHWEIIDYAPATKIDAPSGTARELAAQLGEVKQPTIVIPLDKTVGERNSRGATMNGTQVHSLRLPGYTLSIETIFGAKDERLTIRHDAGSSAEPYLQGTLLAIRRVKNYVGLVRGLEKIME
jgi:4-hydroxy-tetrahydrodipicolinate reductase